MTRILDRWSILQSFFGVFSGGADPQQDALRQAAAAEVAARWAKAFDRQPELVADLIRQGGILNCQPVQMTGGAPMLAPVDPHRLSYEAGRRDLALLLLAQGGFTQDQLNDMMRESTYED